MDADTISNKSENLETELADTRGIQISAINNNKEFEEVFSSPEAFTTELTASKHRMLTNKVITNEVNLKKNESKLNVLEVKSKTCINCGNKYKNCRKYVQSVGSKNNSREDFKQQTSLPTLSQSKCSQFSKNYSHQSLAPCQSFDQCSKCNRVIFARNPSCASFKHCITCKKSCGNICHNLSGYESRDLKVRSVTFSASNNDGKASEKSSFCGCNSSLKCDKLCEKEPENCANSTKSISNLNDCPPKEPSQLSIMKKMLQERIDACSNVQLKPAGNESKKKHVFLSKTRRHHIKKLRVNNDDLECPSNPCCISDERKERLETVTSKLVEREGFRQNKILQKRNEKLKRMQRNECNDMDECGNDGKCNEEETSNKCKAYCKKYKKMKFEIELQNYFVEKLNRELQMKIKKNYPETALLKLKNIFQKEVVKLKEMIEFTIFEQCKNKDLGWGAIPISSLTTNAILMPQTSYGLPKTPSCISNVSTFSMLEDLHRSKEKENNAIQIEFENNRKNHLKAILKEIHDLECKLREVKSVQLHISNRIGSFSNKASKKFNKTTEVGAKTKSQIEHIKNLIDKADHEIDKIHVQIHLILNNK